MRERDQVVTLAVMDQAGLPALQDAISHMHGLKSEWIESVSVKEMFQGETVWEGEVQVFAVEHPKTSRCYAWSHEAGKGGRRRFFSILGLAPVMTASDAVRVAILAT